MSRSSTGPVQGFTIGPEDPPPFTVETPDGVAPLLLVCDHASRFIPERLGGLGLSSRATWEHIAWDIGAACVTRGLAARLGAMAVLGGYSRLLLDLNRPPGDPSRIPAVTCGTEVPGNRDIGAVETEARVLALSRPFHQAIEQAIARLRAQGPPPAVVAIHSFTPDLNGALRPWHVGVLWNRDGRLAVPVLERLRALPGLCVGDNQPYSGREIAYTLDTHAGASGLPHVGIEIRNDQIADEAGCARWVDLLGDLFSELLLPGGDK
ncbi:MAG: N-formylglutamate amidohydrolase [Alphaproteobacteria bacterium]|nr:N-formylglutamate amidohydrolase [Alphaproteobacteria bacterium]